MKSLSVDFDPSNEADIKSAYIVLVLTPDASNLQASFFFWYCEVREDNQTSSLKSVVLYSSQQTSVLMEIPSHNLKNFDFADSAETSHPGNPC